MTKRLIRSVSGLLRWLVLTAVALVVTLSLATANFVATKSALELLGFERRPLRDDELFGWLFEAVAPDATIAHLFAFGLTATLAVAFFLSAYLAARLGDLLEDLSAYRAANEVERGPERGAIMRLRIDRRHGDWLKRSVRYELRKNPRTEAYLARALERGN